MRPGRTAVHGQAIVAGLIVDGEAESIALGLTVAEGEVGVALLAGILVGNTVEAYGAAQPIIASGRSKRSRSGSSPRSAQLSPWPPSSAARCSPRGATRSSARRSDRRRRPARGDLDLDRALCVR
jgi:hypothetical protein